MADFVIMAIDIGSTSGYAVGKNGVVIDSGEVSLSPGVGKTHPGHRWMKFQRFIHDMHSRHNLNEILFEDVTFVNKNNGAQVLKVYGALRGQIEIFTLAYNLRMGALPVTTIKKEFAGSGNAKKPAMCNTAINMGWARGIKDTDHLHNEADAIALLACVYKRRGIDLVFPGAM